MSKESAMAVAQASPSPMEMGGNHGQATEQGAANPSASQTQLPSTQFAQLARKEAEFVRRSQAFKKEQEQVLKEKAEVQKYRATIQQYEEQKKTDPVAALKMLGFTEADIFNYMAANEKKEPTPEERAAQAATEAAEARIKAFEESQKKAQLDQMNRQDMSVINSYKADLSQVIRKDAEKFPYSNYWGSEAADLAYTIAEQVVLQSQGKDYISAQEAVELAEEYYRNKDEDMDRIRKPKVPPAPPASKDPVRTRTISTPEPMHAPKPAIQRTRTINGQSTATVASTRQMRNETPAEKRERLMNILRNGR